MKIIDAWESAWLNKWQKYFFEKFKEEWDEEEQLALAMHILEIKWPVFTERKRNNMLKNFTKEQVALAKLNNEINKAKDKNHNELYGT